LPFPVFLVSLSKTISLKEIKGLCGGVLRYVAQIILQIDAEIAEKAHLWMETSYRGLSALRTLG
jgi:hypothetical protein